MKYDSILNNIEFGGSRAKVKVTVAILVRGDCIACDALHLFGNSISALGQSVVKIFNPVCIGQTKYIYTQSRLLSYITIFIVVYFRSPLSN